MLGGQDDSAEHAIASLLHSHDTVVRDAARITYGAILSARSEWGRLAAFSDSLSTLNSSTPDSLVTSQYRIPADAAGVQAWAAAFRTVAPTRHFADSSTTLPFVRTLTGTPLIEIRVNGVIKHFWIDTGSSITILSSTAAAECGVIPIQPDTLELQTSVGRLPARPTVVHALDVGGLHTSNAPAMIVDASLLTLRTNRRIPLTTPTVRIDGIIGFDVIRHIDLTIDDARGRITIRKPTVRAVRPGTPRNLFWFGVPIVTLTSPLGLVVHLSLDTGAEETYGTGTLVTKSGVRAISAERRTLQGFGGSTTERGVVIPRIRLFLGHTPLLFERVFLYNAQYPTIFELDGTLGADIGRGNVLRIDMTNGRLELTSH
jgi:predicted aspartyl protease